MLGTDRSLSSISVTHSSIEIYQLSPLHLDQPDKRVKLMYFYMVEANAPIFNKRACLKSALQSLGTKSLLIMTIGRNNTDCVIVSGHIKGAARVTNVMYPCGFICIPVVSTLFAAWISLKIKNNYNGTGTWQRSLKAKHCYWKIPGLLPPGMARHRGQGADPATTTWLVSGK